MTERKGFLSRMFGEEQGNDDTRVFSPREVGAAGDEPREVEQHPHGFTVERAAEIIKDLPPDVSHESAVRIVRGTLVAAGIRFEDLERSTRARETKLRSEIDLARGRQDELKERTEEVLRTLEEDMRKAREALDNGVTEEDERISRANSGLQDIRQVRGFFGFPGEDAALDAGADAEPDAQAQDGEQTTDDEEAPGAKDAQWRKAPWTRPADPEEQAAEHREAPFAPEAGDETRIMEPYDDADETRVIRRSGPLAPPEDAGER